MPEWIRNAVWWHVYPLGFVDAEATAAEAGSAPARHRLGRLEPWLDYAAELGATGLALGPIFASETHGYDTVDHYRIDARLGDDDDFDRLVAAATERGLRVLLDGVFNHVGRGFPTFRRAVELGPSSSEARWFRLTWPAPWQPGTEPDYADFEGHHALVALDHGRTEVASYVIDVMDHWLRRGAAGWRLDAAYAVPTAFWAEVSAEVRRRHPDAYLVGEVIHGDYAGFVASSGLDAVTQYELWKAVWSSLNDRNFFELASALERHNRYLEAFAPLTFVGNHDVTRLATRLTDERHLAHALVVLLTTGGTPSIYYGDEQAFRGRKEDRAGGDDAVRPAFPDGGPPALASAGWATYRLHQQLVALRRRHPWLHRATTTPTHLANAQLVYESRRAGDDRLVVALNVADESATVPVPAPGELLAGEDGSSLDGRGTALSLPARGWAVLAG
jgi:cyclomaltodextrinase